MSNEIGLGVIPLGREVRAFVDALGLLNQRIAHGGHPVLAMCAANATVQTDPAGNRKLSKMKSHGRIDGMVALAMARSVAGTYLKAPPVKSFWMA